MLSMFSASEMLISFIINSAEKTGPETRPDPGRKKSNRECGINCIHISLFCINAQRCGEGERRRDIVIQFSGGGWHGLLDKAASTPLWPRVLVVKQEQVEHTVRGNNISPYCAK